MTTDELVAGMVFETNLLLPGYTQLLPKKRSRYESRIKRWIKQYDTEKMQPKDLD